MVLAHSWDAYIDDHGEVVMEVDYTLDTANPDPAARLRSLLRVPGGNDFYGVMRTDMLRRVGEHHSYYNADRTFVAGLVLQGTVPPGARGPLLPPRPPRPRLARRQPA